jgi:hypothetical protein
MEMATNTGIRRNFPTLRLMAAPFRWVFRSRRRVLAVAAIVLAILATPAIWWSVQLAGLPDIGDPFDVAAFRALTIPDERNAAVIYRQAAERLAPFAATPRPMDQAIDMNARWSKADPFLRGWLERNREALALFRAGTERPDAMGLAGYGPDDREARSLRGSLASFHLLAVLEASRLEDQGDMAGAWDWYRAAFRATYHLGRHGTSLIRLGTQNDHLRLRGRARAWAADRRTSPELIRRALEDVLACGGLVPSEPYTLKADYPLIENELKRPNPAGRDMLMMKLAAGLSSPVYQLNREQAEWLADHWRAWRRESERSRRVLRLFIANRLAYLELPPDRQPDPDPSVTGRVDLFAFGPEAPAKARVLSPRALDHWLSTTDDARELLIAWNLTSIRVKERANHRALVVLLASELYRRDHKTDPTSDEALVGPYLKELPDDGTGNPVIPAPTVKTEALKDRASSGRE